MMVKRKEKKIYYCHVLPNVKNIQALVNQFKYGNKKNEILKKYAISRKNRQMLKLKKFEKMAIKGRKRKKSAIC